MILAIITEPNPILRKRAVELKTADLVSVKIKNLITNLTETMHQRDGVGIAAPQVGKSIRLCVINKKYANTADDLILINPIWNKKTIRTTTDSEGCLSVPGMWGDVKRYKKISVQAIDVGGAPLNFSAEDFFARIIQHEVDHLDGILFIDKAKKLFKEKTETAL